MTSIDPAQMCFHLGEIENPRFFQRLGGEPSFEGKRILDFGCGHSSLCIYVALKGAAKVLGIDVDKSRIAFAREKVWRDYPHLERVCEFRHADIRSVTEHDVDIIPSKDTFEHVLDLRYAARMDFRQQARYLATAPLVSNLQGEYGIIEYTEPNVYATHLRISPEVQEMTDQQILDRLCESSHIRVCTSRVRRLLGHGNAKSVCIEAVRGDGYRLTVGV